MARSKAYLFGGVEIRWSLRQGTAAGSTTCRRKRPSISPSGLKDYLEATHQRADAGASGHLRRQVEQARRPRHGRMGGRLGSPMPTASSPPTATPSRPPTAARTRSACAARCCKGLKDHAERIGQGKRAAPITADDVMTGAAAHALGVHPRAGIPGPDQGPAGHRRGHAHRRERDEGSLRPLARRQPARRPTSCSTG